MTIIHPISMNDSTEAFGGSFTPTPMTQRFAFMQAALALYLDAERDLAQSGAWDPACDHWLRDAEAARTALAAGRHRTGARPSGAGLCGLGARAAGGRDSS